MLCLVLQGDRIPLGCVDGVPGVVAENSWVFTPSLAVLTESNPRPVYPPPDLCCALRGVSQLNTHTGYIPTVSPQKSESQTWTREVSSRVHGTPVSSGPGTHCAEAHSLLQPSPCGSRDWGCWLAERFLIVEIIFFILAHSQSTLLGFFFFLILHLK